MRIAFLKPAKGGEDKEKVKESRNVFAWKIRNYEERGFQGYTLEFLMEYSFEQVSVSDLCFKRATELNGQETSTLEIQWDLKVAVVTTRLLWLLQHMLDAIQYIWITAIFCLSVDFTGWKPVHIIQVSIFPSNVCRCDDDIQQHINMMLRWMEKIYGYRLSCTNGFVDLHMQE
ncbi:hypothetical protein P3X46_029537 [Hevea brasiliensis]|uniref:Uncharacterized protein n=1 Tax=Hevea brasiliensis TaxID=3981 RepID=A0ABQ9KVM0_HEVBR|nr:uncharacterized protein LOC110637863 [Hevea brasiliensis]KAJ9147363.1 hypothetical protein P3X46_029537 [Hevea brasiliensis]